MGSDLALVNPILPTGAGSESGQLAVYFNQIASDGSLRVALETSREIAGLDFGLAFPWHNVIRALDVSGDLKIAAGDALDVINFLNAFRSQPVPPDLTSFGPFFDVTADGTVAPEDALAIINHINAFGTGGEGESGGEGEEVAGAALLMSTGAVRSLRVELPLADLIGLLALDVSSQPKRRR